MRSLSVGTMLASLLLCNSVGGCAAYYIGKDAAAPHPDRYLTEATRQQDEQERVARAAEEVDLRQPSPPPNLNYDLQTVSRLEPYKGPTEAFCERVEQWRRYVGELPATERARVARLRKRYGGGSQLYNTDPYYRLQINLDQLERVTQGSGWDIIGVTGDELQRFPNPPGHVITADEDAVARKFDRPIPDLEQAIALIKCGGGEPHPRLVAELTARKDAEAAAARCAATPACVAQKKRERLAELGEALCHAYGQRQAAKEGIKEEWRYAREAGVVDLGNLRDQRRMLEIQDDDIEEFGAEWKTLSGKPFNAKHACSTASR